MLKNKTNTIRNLNSEDISCPKSQQDFATDILVGLSLSPKRLACKYIYDKRGSQLFQKIMELPEYYLTQCEIEILEKCKEKIFALTGRRSLRMVELGIGDGKKTKILLKEMMNQKIDFTFNPIDISHSAVKELITGLQNDMPEIYIEGLVTEYFKGLKWLSSMDQRINVVLFLGSNIGNFEPHEADIFLSNLWNACNDGDFILIGLDLKKDTNVLIKAYNDSKGVTAQFILNILNRINQELGGHFILDQFKYYSTYHVVEGAIKTYLISLQDQTVCIDELNREFSFLRWEPIHVESSYKYYKNKIRKLARQNGFVVVENFFDAREYFVDSLWRVEKNPIFCP